MSRIAPYTLRRGDALYLRIAIPSDLQTIWGAREVMRTLGTSDKQQALPVALECAAVIKRVFADLRKTMADGDPTHEELESLIAEIERGEQRKVESSARLMRMVADAKMKIALLIQAEESDRQHTETIRELKQQVHLARLEGEARGLRHALAHNQAQPKVIPAPIPENPVAAQQVAPVPMLKTVVDGFLGKYQQDKKPAMFKKHRPVLSMLLEVIGDKPVNQLKQADINNFFELLGRLPPRWADECRKRKLTVLELAELDFDLTLGPKSFDDTYIASVRPFLKAAKKDWQDQGFPLGLTTDGIEYLGDREEGEDKQRAFKPDELVRLFEGDEMRGFANQAACLLSCI